MGKGESMPSMLTIKLQVWYDSPHCTHPPEKPHDNEKKIPKENQTNLRHDDTTQRDTDTNIIPSSPRTEKVAVHQL